MPGDIILLYIRVYHESYMVPEIWSAINVCRFGPFFALSVPLQPGKLKLKKKNTWRYYHFIHLHHKWQSYESYNVFIILQMCPINDNHMITTDSIFYYFGPFFAVLTPLQPKKSKFSRKKMHGDIIILHKCTKHQGHMIYCSWLMYLLFFILGFFLPFCSLKISKK